MKNIFCLVITTLLLSVGGIGCATNHADGSVMVKPAHSPYFKMSGMLPDWAGFGNTVIQIQNLSSFSLTPRIDGQLVPDDRGGKYSKMAILIPIGEIRSFRVRTIHQWTTATLTIDASAANGEKLGVVPLRTFTVSGDGYGWKNPIVIRNWDIEMIPPAVLRTEPVNTNSVSGAAPPSPTVISGTNGVVGGKRPEKVWPGS